MGKVVCVGFDGPGDDGCKLILREGPPASGPTYGPDDKGDLLGFAVGRVSLPRWMCSQFASAVNDGIDLTKYSDDWIEKVFYVPTDGQPPDDDEKRLVGILCDLCPCLDLMCANGCGTNCPRAILQAVSLSDDNKLVLSPPDSAFYYSSVATHKPDDPTMFTEWTVATQANRPKFENSDFQARINKLGFEGRYLHDHSLRTQAFDTIRNLPRDFKP